MTKEQAIGLQALLGAMKASASQPVGQFVDLGHGYKAFVKNPGLNQLSDTLMGAGSGAAEGALSEFFKEQETAEREVAADKDFGRRLALMDQEFTLRERGADADQGRRFGEMDRRFELGEKGAESDMGRRFKLMDQEFSLRERGAGADFGRKLDLYGRERDDKVSEALAAAGLKPSGYADRAGGLDALAGRYGETRDEDMAMQRAAGIARLMDGGLSLEQAQAVMSGRAAPTGGAGAGLVNPPTPQVQALAGVSDRQQRLLAELEAIKKQRERSVPNVDPSRMMNSVMDSSLPMYR